MALTFVVPVRLNADYYRERADKNTREELLKEMRAEVEDQLSEYNFSQILEEMIHVSASLSDKTLYCEQG